MKLNYKKNLILLLIVVMSMSSISFAQSMSVDEKVKVLDDINIFKGDGDGYKLDQKLKRSEAATLIVRLMGKTNEVNNNKDKYVNTKFSDVKSDEWYAQYIGYCSKNDIILGFPDNTFKPNEYITEKAFTQLVLGVLGYKSGTDFDWDTVLRYSLEVGLNSDVEYAFKNIDNVLYKRQDAVELMYTALTTRAKDAGPKVIDILIKNGVTSIEVAQNYKLYTPDEMKTDFKSLSVTSKNTLRATFNEEIYVDDKDIEISLNGNVLDIENINRLPDFIEVITKENLASDDQYEIKIVSIKDNYENITNNLTAKFKGYSEPRIVSPYFKISKVSPIASNRIKVYFTHPIDESAKQVLLYEFYKNGDKYFEGSFKNLSVSLDSSENDAMILTSSGFEFDTSSEYKIVVRGDLKSLYGAHLNSGDGDSMIFSGVDGTINEISVVDASFYDKNLVKITFTGPVDKESAMKLSNYKLVNEENNLEISPNRVYFSKYEVEDDSEIVLRFNSTKSNASYNIKVNDIYDSIKVNKIANTVINIGQGINDYRSPSIVSVAPLNRSTIEIVFDMRLNESSKNASIYISEGIHARVKSVDLDDPYKMIVYISKSKFLEDDLVYKLKVSGGLVDELERRQRYTITDEFPGTNMVEEDTVLETATFISQNLIMASFNNDIRKSDVSSTDKFEYVYKEGNVSKNLFVSSVKFVDSKTVILGFDYSLNGGDLKLIAKDYYNITGEKKYEKSEIIVEGLNNIN